MLFSMQGANAVSYKINVNIIVESELFSTESLQNALTDCRKGSDWRRDFYFRVGSSIKVLNESSKLVGLGKVKSAKFLKDEDPELFGNQLGDIMGYCTYQGVVSVKKSEFYSILIDGRGGAEYSFADLRKLKWKVTLFI